MSDTHINEMREIASSINSLRVEETKLKTRRKELMKEAHNNGMTYQAIGDALGVTKAYVHQQIGNHRVVETTNETSYIVDADVNG